MSKVLLLPAEFEAESVYSPASKEVVLVMVRLEFVAFAIGEPL